MDVPADRKYTKTHEWFLVEGDVVTIGVTQYAADELTDITYVELPGIGTAVSAGDRMGEVESVKATSEILTAVAGTVIEINTELEDHPELVNDDAYGQGWLLKITPETLDPIEALMDAEAYAAEIG